MVDLKYLSDEKNIFAREKNERLDKNIRGRTGCSKKKRQKKLRCKKKRKKINARDASNERAMRGNEILGY